MNRPSVSRKITDFVLFQVLWVLCVGGAGRGFLWIGPAAAVVFLVFSIAASRRRLSALTLVLAATVVGLVVDTGYAVSGVMAYVGAPAAPLPPPWIVVLWMVFAATLTTSLEWLSGRIVLAALLGAVCGPLCYLAGEQLGAVTIGQPRLASFALLVISWALAVPTLMMISDRLFTPGDEDRSFAAVPDPQGYES